MNGRLCFLCLVFSLFFGLAATAQAANPILKLHSRGKDVVLVQELLADLGYGITSFDGVFGQETRRAVEQLQQDYKLKADGVVNAPTWNTLLRTQNPFAGRPGQIGFGGRPAGRGAAGVLTTAKRYIGVPYLFGGETPKGFDCSGYIQFVFRLNGVTLPRTADLQYKAGSAVQKTRLRPGDLVFFSTYEPGPSHNGIYIGDGKFIHASSSKGVRIDELRDPYWLPRYLGARRVLN